MRKLMMVGCALMSAFAAFAEGENPYPEYDFYLTVSDSNTDNSWNKTGHWSGAWPDDALGKTFYVPADKTLSSYGTSSAKAGAWLGGTLTVAGQYDSSPKGSSGYCASITNLVFLDDSIFSGGAYGLLLDDAKSDITVKAAADHPLTVQYTYGTGSNSYYGRFPAVVHGAPGTGMIFMMTQATSTFRFHADSFEDFFGTLTVTGAKVTPMQPSSNSHWFTSPGKLVVTDSAVFTPSHPTADTRRENVLLGALEVKNGGIIDFRCNTKNAGYKDAAYVTFDVTNSVKVSNGGIVRVSNVTSDNLIECAKSGVAADYRMAVRLAHLTDDAKDQVNVDDAKVEMSGLDESYNEIFDWKLIVQDNGDGSKELYAGVTNVAVNCSAVSKDSFSENGRSGWAGSVLPAAGNVMLFTSAGRFYISSDHDDILPYSRIIWAGFSGGEIVQGPTTLNFKSLDVIGTTTCTIRQSSAGTRKLTGGPLTIHDGARLNFSVWNQSYSGTQYRPNATIEQEIRGNGTLQISPYSANASNRLDIVSINTNWHGRFVFQLQCNSRSDGHYSTQIANALCWGGTFLADTNTYSAVTISNSPCVFVPNDVCFNDPTRGFSLNDAPRFNVAEGAKLTLSNQVTYAGIVEKEGAGALNLGGTARFEDGQPETAPVEGRCGLLVSGGTLEVSSRAAVDGLDVSFAAGTKLVVGKDCGFYNVKSAAPLTIADEQLPVEIAGFDEKPENDGEVTVLTLNKTAAEGIGTDKFAFTRTPACKVLKLEKREVGDNVEYVATIEGKRGILLIVR